RRGCGRSPGSRPMRSTGPSAALFTHAARLRRRSAGPRSRRSGQSPPATPSPAGSPGMAEDATRPPLAVRDLEGHFPGGRGLLSRRAIAKVRAVDGVDLDLVRGEAVGLVGESGCGKSTLGRAILQLVRPTAGHVRFDGRELSGLDEAELRPMRRRMQMVFQD